jgi:hypothetical protein
MDEKLAIMHLRLAIVGGMVIVCVGVLSLLRFHHFPILSFVIGPLISLTALNGLRELAPRRRPIEIRITPERRRPR